jgi:hypothetical protein
MTELQPLTPIIKALMARQDAGVTSVTPGVTPVPKKPAGSITDSGSEIMTVHDLAALLQTDVKAIQRQTETRAQQRAKFPMPFFKLNGALRFERKKIQEWLHNLANSTPFNPVKAKRGRPRKAPIA